MKNNTKNKELNYMLIGFSSFFVLMAIVTMLNTSLGYVKIGGEPAPNHISYFLLLIFNGLSILIAGIVSKKIWLIILSVLVILLALNSFLESANGQSSFLPSTYTNHDPIGYLILGIVAAIPMLIYAYINLKPEYLTLYAGLTGALIAIVFVATFALALPAQQKLNSDRELSRNLQNQESAYSNYQNNQNELNKAFQKEQNNAVLKAANTVLKEASRFFINNGNKFPSELNSPLGYTVIDYEIVNTVESKFCIKSNDPSNNVHHTLYFQPNVSSTTEGIYWLYDGTNNTSCVIEDLRTESSSNLSTSTYSY